MKINPAGSSGGQHFLALDHVRAVAAFMVFSWHFLHSTNGYPVPFESQPWFAPLALFDEGHTGVALFMTLSGYLFAKLIGDAKVRYKDFLFNRCLRLLPLLALVLLLRALRDLPDWSQLPGYLLLIAKGLVLPTLPNGGWSITVEFHFYLLLPVLLVLCRRWHAAAWLVIGLMLLLRAALYAWLGEVQTLSYWTLVGRLDQFLLGIMAFRIRSVLRSHTIALVSLVVLCVAYQWFNAGGGFYLRPSYPSPDRLWIVWPTLEGLGYASLIAWYDQHCRSDGGMLGRWFGKIGTYAYSIYLLHFFVVFEMAAWVDLHIMRLSSFNIALCWSFVCFLLMVPLAHLSHRFIETPFMRLRRPYLAARGL